MTRAVCSSFGFKKSDIVGGTFGGEVSDASVHGVRDSRGSRCVGGGCCWNADVCENGVDDSGRDGEVAWVEVLPSCACCPHVVARVVVIRAVIAIAFQKKSDDSGSNGRPVGAMRQGALEPVMNQIHHCQSHAGRERHVWQCGGVASQAAL